MVKKSDLAKLETIMLALMCKKLWQDESQPKHVRDTACKFKDRWFELVDQETPPKQNGKQFAHIEKELAQLKAEMVEFLHPFI